MPSQPIPEPGQTWLTYEGIRLFICHTTDGHGNRAGYNLLTPEGQWYAVKQSQSDIQATLVRLGATCLLDSAKTAAEIHLVEQMRAKVTEEEPLLRELMHRREVLRQLEQEAHP